MLERARPRASIGAWCRPGGFERYSCVSVVDEPRAGLYECRAWIVRTDRRVGLELLRTGPAGCPSREATPASGGEAH